jgi:hypothetical protein
MPGQETELHTDDTVNIQPLKLQCTSCDEYMLRETATVDGTRSKYTYVCQTAGCGADVHVLVPRNQFA